MYCLTTYRAPALVIAALWGRFSEEEVHCLCRDLDRQMLRGDGGPPSMLLDLGRMEPQGEAVVALLYRYVERSVEAGVRVARVVENRLVAHELERVAEGAGLLDRLRTFAERDSALVWVRAPAAV
ncbi:MAG: hypothetical protein RBU30_12470 [Polyangia bacterium]|jgi:hypothetical protein|nr:hypothetical protein [Polyangia bacterium]